MCDKSRNTWLCVHWQWNTLEWCQLNALQASPVVHLVTPLPCVSLSMNTQPSVPAILSSKSSNPCKALTLLAFKLCLKSRNPLIQCAILPQWFNRKETQPLSAKDPPHILEVNCGMICQIVLKERLTLSLLRIICNIGVAQTLADLWISYTRLLCTKVCYICVIYFFTCTVYFCTSSYNSLGLMFVVYQTTLNIVYLILSRDALFDTWK